MAGRWHGLKCFAVAHQRRAQLRGHGRRDRSVSRSATARDGVQLSTRDGDPGAPPQRPMLPSPPGRRESAEGCRTPSRGVAHFIRPTRARPAQGKRAASREAHCTVDKSTSRPLSHCKAGSRWWRTCHCCLTGKLAMSIGNPSTLIKWLRARMRARRCGTDAINSECETICARPGNEEPFGR